MPKRADENGPFKEFRIDEWLRDEFVGKCEEMGFKKTRLDTSEFESHMRKAAKEQLLAVRSLVDSFIDVVEGKEEKQAASKTQNA